MKEVITSKGKTVLVPDDCDGPRNRRPKWRPNQRLIYSRNTPASQTETFIRAVAPTYGPRVQMHRERLAEATHAD